MNAIHLVFNEIDNVAQFDPNIDPTATAQTNCGSLQTWLQSTMGAGDAGSCVTLSSCAVSAGDGGASVWSFSVSFAPSGCTYNGATRYGSFTVAVGKNGSVVSVSLTFADYRVTSASSPTGHHFSGSVTIGTADALTYSVYTSFIHGLSLPDGGAGGTSLTVDDIIVTIPFNESMPALTITASCGYYVVNGAASVVGEVSLAGSLAGSDAGSDAGSSGGRDAGVSSFTATGPTTSVVNFESVRFNYGQCFPSSGSLRVRESTPGTVTIGIGPRAETINVLRTVVTTMTFSPATVTAGEIQVSATVTLTRVTDGGMGAPIGPDGGTTVIPAWTITVPNDFSDCRFDSGDGGTSIDATRPDATRPDATCPITDGAVRTDIFPRG